MKSVFEKFTDEGVDYPISVTFTEADWRFVSVCLSIVRDSEELCDDCLMRLYELHESMCHQIVAALDEYISEAKA